MVPGTLSVIIPAYNREQYLSFTLLSLTGQSHPAQEILVVDDGSTDGTADVAEKRGVPIRVIRQENKGPGAARNRGFAESTGEFIHFFDSDDLAASNKHEVQLNALEKSGADIAYGPWIKGGIFNNTFVPVNQVYQQKGLPRGDLVKALLCNWSVVPHACLFRRTMVEKVNGFPEDLRVAEDQLMFLRCLLAGARVVHTPGTLELYRVGNADSITESASHSKNRVFDWARFLVLAHSECVENGIQPARWHAFRTRAWLAGNDLRKHGLDTDDMLARELGSIHGDKRKILYKITNILQRRTSSLQARILNRRGNASFRMGPLNNHQEMMIRKLGYQVQPTVRP